MIMPWKKLRIFLLATICILVILAVVKSNLYPNVPNNSISPFTFPANIPLEQWRLVESVPLPTPDVPNYLGGQEYRYQKDNLSLNVEMRYLIPYDGGIENLIRNVTSIKLVPGNMELFHKEGIGNYGLFLYEGRSYLTACINPRGNSTVTVDQYRRNRNSYDFHVSRIIPWLLGKDNMRDLRCLWANMSVPVDNISQKEAYQILENAWFDWYRWWQPRFPPR